MPSTYTTNLGIEKIATGEQSGTWGTTSNTNFDLIDEAINGVEQVTLAAAGSSGSPNDLPITEGASSDGRNKFIEFIDGGDLGATAFVQLTPNDAEKVVHIRNSLSADRTITIFQGTYNASNDFVIPNGADVVLKFDGAGAGAVVSDVFVNLTPTKLTAAEADVTTVNATTVDTTNLEVTNLKAKDGTSAGSIANSTGVVTLASSVLTTTDINGGTVDGADITVGTGKTLDVSAGTLTLANDQISGDKVQGGTIGSTTITTLTSTTGNITTVNATTVDTTNIEVTNVKAKDGTASATIADSTGVMTIASSVLTTTDINGGTIDGVTIGGASAGAGTFTTLTTSGSVVFNDAGANVDFRVEGDTDANLLFVNAGADAVGIGTASPSTILSLGPDSNTTQSISFSGTRGQVQYDATRNAGTGALVLLGGNKQIDIDTGGENQVITFITDSTERTRIDTSGTLIHKRAATFNEDGANADFRVESDNNTHGLFVDAGTDRVGILNSTPSQALDVNGNGIITGNTRSLQIGTTGASFLYFNSTSGSEISHNANALQLITTQTSGITFNTGGANQRLRIDASGNFIFNEDGADADFRVESDTDTHALFVEGSSGNVGIGTSSISADTRLAVVGPRVGNSLDNATQLLMSTATTVSDRLNINFSMSGVANRARAGIGAISLNAGGSNCALGFYTRNAPDGSQLATTDERMRIDSAGLLTHQAAATFNESGADADFRVESDTSTHALFVDAGNDRIGVGTSTPAVSLDLGSKTDAIALPAGTTAQRPGSPDEGYIRFNTDILEPEWYNDFNDEWVAFRSTPLLPISVDFLVIAGGGGAVIGGGGAGGYRTSVGSNGGGAATESALTLNSKTSHTVTVGAGGGVYTAGSNSVFATVTSNGGGRGSDGGDAGTLNGGSGGGGRNVAGGTGSQGFNGGSSSSTTSGGGGGGAGQVGSSSSGTTGAAGGNGIASTITGSSTTRGGGGGGGGSGSGGAAGSGGGGAGSDQGGTSGTVNTGGGGGGGFNLSGGSGGSGVVIIKYPDSFTITNSGGGLTFTTASSGGFKVTTFTAGSGNIQFD